MTGDYGNLYGELLVRLVGTAKAPIVARHYPRPRDLRDVGPSELQAIGLTRRQADALSAAFTLAAMAGIGAGEPYRPGVRAPSDVARMVPAYVRHADRETFGAIYLNARQRVLDVQTIAIGSLAEVEVHPREVFRPGVRMGAHSVIVFHNHPSGECEPSQADIDLTHRLVDVGRTIGIPVLDHIVVAGSQHASLASMGMVG